jgi:hypothetical protein
VSIATQPARGGLDMRAMSNTAICALLSASFVTALFATGCGAMIVDDADPTGDLDPIGIDPTPESPLLIDAPRAATTARSLFQLSLRDHASMVALVGVGGEPQVDVVEQRIVTKHAEPVALDISMTPPSGTFSRIIASDAIREQYQVLDHVLCKNGNIATYDPKCETALPVPVATPTSGALTAARWRVWVMDEQTGAAVDGCSAIGTQLSCTLPGRAVASYRIVGSVDSVAELWGGPGAAAVGSLAGNVFTGATQLQYQCWDWSVSGPLVYCEVYWRFTRYAAIKHASLELDPMHIELAADGIASSGDSPALGWDGGIDDLPGTTY